jgi:hypothetical protein
VVLNNRVYLKERREGIEKGEAQLGNKRVQGAFGEMAIPYLPIRTEQRRGLTGRPTGGGGSALRRSSAQRRPGGGAKRRGGRGDLGHVLTLC